MTTRSSEYVTRNRVEGGLVSSRRIYIDERTMAGGGTGVATYARTLETAIRLGDRTCGRVRAKAGNDILRFIRAVAPGSVRLQQDRGDLSAPDIFRVAQVRFKLTGEVLRLRAPGPPAIMHWTYPVPLMIEGWANIYTVHDVIPLTRPDLTPIDGIRHARLLTAVTAVADRLVTVSQAARGEIAAAIDIQDGRLIDCGQAVLATAPSADLPADLPADLMAGGYLLFCGRIEPRKNLSRLIAAYAASGVDLPLVLAGPVVEGSADILAAASMTERILYLGYVDEPVLRALVAQARALLLPSLHEGFGLPVAEAMTVGTPVMISGDPALVETAGGAALVVDGSDTAGIAAAIASLACDDALCNALRRRGLARAPAFSVARLATALGRLYAQLD